MYDDRNLFAMISSFRSEYKRQMSVKTILTALNRGRNNMVWHKGGRGGGGQTYVWNGFIHLFHILLKSDSELSQYNFDIVNVEFKNKENVLLHGNSNLLHFEINNGSLQNWQSIYNLAFDWFNDFISMEFYFDGLIYSL